MKFNNQIAPKKGHGTPCPYSFYISSSTYFIYKFGHVELILPAPARNLKYCTGGDVKHIPSGA